MTRNEEERRIERGIRPFFFFFKAYLLQSVDLIAPKAAEAISRKHFNCVSITTGVDSLTSEVPHRPVVTT